MSDVAISSDEDIGEIRSEDENDLQVVQETGEVEEFGPTDNAEQETAADETDSQKQQPKVKRAVNPQPKLNADRLKGPRGIQTVEGILSKINFKGRGHEEEDLNSLMRGYEYWCHRLFPKFTFDDCLKKIERLGAKREIQTHIKKIRMNLLFSDDINGTAPMDDENETELNESENVTVQNDPFNELLSVDTENTDIREASPTPHSESTKLSEEQLERMRINRERAKRIRVQKMISMHGAAQVESNLSQPEASSCTNLVNPDLSIVPNSSEQSNLSEQPLVDSMMNNESLSFPLNDNHSISEVIEQAIEI